MAWNIGANDLANSMASAVGAKAITLKQAIIFGGLFAFIGAVFVGSHVAETIRKGIIDPTVIDDPNILAVGAISALLGASIWITIATWKELPISTTHSIVGGLLGFGLIAGGIEVISWTKVGEISASWVISPVLGGVFSYIIIRTISRFIFDHKDPVYAIKGMGPVFIGITFFIIGLSLFLKTPLGKQFTFQLEQSILIAAIIGMCAATVGYIMIIKFLEKVKMKAYDTVEEVFKNLQIMTSCYVAFALGANDVANAIGPATTVHTAITGGDISAEVAVPYYFLIIGGIGITIGIATWGYKVIKTIGTKITKLTNTRGFSVDFGGATSVLIASKLGMPVSTTHAVVGAVIGVGLARGLAAVDLSIIKKIIVSWVITIPIAALTTIGLFLTISQFI
jgi:PiT family inorganic phosphate transporter